MSNSHAVSRRSLLALGAGLSGAAVLTACNSNSDSPSPQGSKSAGPMTGKLTVWCWDPNFNIYSMNEAAKIYKKDHPDVTVDVQEVPWDDVQTKLTTLAQSKQTDQLPDIFLMQNNAFQKNVTNYPEVFTKIANDDIKYSDFPDSVNKYSTVDDVHYGVPFDNGTAITVLRTDMLEQAGLTTKDFTDITWTQFTELGTKVKTASGKPMLTSTAGSSDLVLMMLQSAGASLFDGEGKPTITDNKALMVAINTYIALVKAGVLQEVNSWDEYVGSIVNSNVVGTVNGAWILATVQSAKDQAGKWGMTNVPKLEGVDGATNYTTNGGSSWAISSNANYSLAVDFLSKTFAGSTELYDTILPSTGAIAYYLPAAKSPAYSKPQPFFNDQPIYADILDYAAKVPSNNTGVYYYEARDAVSAAITKIINGTDANTALAEAQQTVEFAMNS